MSLSWSLRKRLFQPTRGARYSHRRRHRGTKIEVKLAVPASDLQKLKCLLLAMPDVRSGVKSDSLALITTSDRALHRKQLTLRVREQRRKFVQTVKAGDLAGSDLCYGSSRGTPVLQRLELRP